MDNPYLRTLETAGVEAAVAHVEKDASLASTACNPTALSGALHRMLAFSLRVDASTRERLQLPIEIVLTQISWLLVDKNVASCGAWKWLIEYEHAA